MNTYSIPEHVYANFFNEDLIVLDSASDEFIILNDDYKTAFLKKDDEKIRQIHEHIFSEFLSVGLLTNKNLSDHNRRVYSSFDMAPKEGSANVEWRMQYNPCKLKSSASHFIPAYKELLIVSNLLSQKGLRAVLARLESHTPAFSSYKIPPPDELHQMAVALNKAVFYFPKSVRCLLWSATFVSWALKRKLQCQFVIGAQNYPFVSHAWVETKHGVLEDHVNLPQKMAIITRVPHS